MNQKVTFDPVWSNIFEGPRVGIYTIIDPQVGKDGDGTLRCIPFLTRFGLANFTFPSEWMSHALFPFDYISFEETIGTRLNFPLCQIISQKWENNVQCNCTTQIMSKAISTKKKELFVIVIDTEQFHTKDTLGPKPLIEELDLSDGVFRYEKIFLKYLRLMGIDSPLISLSETQNLSLHEMAAQQFWSTGEKPRTIPDLFEYSAIPASSYAWSILNQFSDDRFADDASKKISIALTPWIEKNKDVVVSRIVTALRDNEFDRNKIEQWRNEEGRFK